MTARQYAAGVAILAMLLLSSAVAATYVDVGGSTPSPQLATDADRNVRVDGSTGAPPGPYLPPGASPDDATFVDIIFGTGGNQWPWSTALGTSMHFQMLYRATNINKSGSIESWAWQCYSATASRVFNNVTIKMCHTSLAALTFDMNGNFAGNTPVTVAALPSVTIGGGVVGAWMPMPQTSTFSYNGTSNLLIDITWQSANAGGPTWVRYGSPGYNGRAWVWSWSSNTASYVDGMDYNVRLGFIDLANDVGVTKIISPSDPYYAFGDTFYMKAEVKNMGLNAQTGVPVHCVLKEKVTSTTVYNQTVPINLLVGQTDTVDFPGFYYPGPVEAVFVDTMRTEMVTPVDQMPSNDWQANEAVVTEWGSLCASYTDNTWENGTRYVTAPYDGEYCTEFTMVGEKVTGVNIWLSDIPASTLNKRVRIYAMDGPGGAPGTTPLYDQIHSLTAAYWPAVTKNAITFGTALSIPPTVTKIGVSYGWNLQVAQFVCIDRNPVITVGNDWGRAGPASPWDHVLSNTADNACDLGIEACFWGRLLDGSIVDITVPPAEVDSNTTFTPQIVVKNCGLKVRTNIPVAFNIVSTSDPADTIYSDTANSGPVGIGQTRMVDLTHDVTPDPGNYTMTCISLMPYDTRTANDTLVMPLLVRSVGVATESTDIGRVSFAIAPNPLGGFATVRYSLANAGLAALDMFDVMGRTVLTQTIVAARTGTATLDLRRIKAGVYLVKVTSEGFSTTQKLVVGR